MMIPLSKSKIAGCFSADDPSPPQIERQAKHGSSCNAPGRLSQPCLPTGGPTPVISTPARWGPFQEPGLGRVNRWRQKLLQISDSAMEFLQDALEQAAQEDHNPSEETVFRLMVVEDSFALKLDSPGGDDVLFERRGAPVLATTPELAQSMQSVLDLEETAQGPRLVVVTM